MSRYILQSRGPVYWGVQRYESHGQEHLGVRHEELLELNKRAMAASGIIDQRALGVLG